MAGAHILVAIVFTILQLTAGQQSPGYDEESGQVSGYYTTQASPSEPTQASPSEPLVCDTESEEFSRLDYTKNDAACANYTAPANMAAVMICDHFCTEIDYDFLRVYNDADGSLLGTYHGGHCLRNSILIYHQLIVVSRSGRISADWSGNGGTTRTGFLFCSFTPFQQADAPVGHDNSMFNGYWDPVDGIGQGSGHYTSARPPHVEPGVCSVNLPTFVIGVMGGKYKNNEDICHNFTGPHDAYFRVRCPRFCSEPGRDFMKMYDENGVMIRREDGCGASDVTRGVTYLSPTNIMTIRFTSNSRVTKAAFRCNVRAIRGSFTRK